MMGKCGKNANAGTGRTAQTWRKDTCTRVRLEASTGRLSAYPAMVLLALLS
jgi:hypothetical protein